MDTKGGKGGEMNQEVGIDTFTLRCAGNAFIGKASEKVLQPGAGPALSRGINPRAQLPW